MILSPLRQPRCRAGDRGDPAPRHRARRRGLGLVPGGSYDLLNALAGLLGHTINSVQDDPDLEAALETLSVANASQFAVENPDDPRVAYYSVAGRSSGQTADSDCAGSVWENPPTIDLIDPLLSIPGAFLSGPDILNPVVNDGLVTLDSAKLGNLPRLRPR